MTAEQINETEIYSIEMYDGQKIIHILSYFWTSDVNYRSTDYTFLMIPISDFIKMLNDGGDDLANAYCEVKQYEADIEDEQEWIDMFENYCDGQIPQRLDYQDITEDTPCGDYYAKLYYK